MSDERTPKSVPSIIPVLARLTMIGWFVGVSIAGGALLGWWLDGLIGSATVAAGSRHPAWDRRCASRNDANVVADWEVAKLEFGSRIL